MLHRPDIPQNLLAISKNKEVMTFNILLYLPTTLNNVFFVVGISITTFGYHYLHRNEKKGKQSCTKAMLYISPQRVKYVFFKIFLNEV